MVYLVFPQELQLNLTKVLETSFYNLPYWAGGFQKEVAGSNLYQVTTRLPRLQAQRSYPAGSLHPSASSSLSPSSLITAPAPPLAHSQSPAGPVFWPESESSLTERRDAAFCGPRPSPLSILLFPVLWTSCGPHRIVLQPSGEHVLEPCLCFLSCLLC